MKKDERAAIVADVSDVVFAVRNAQAPWFLTRHRIALVMLASVFPNPSPTGDEIAACTGLSRTTVSQTMRELREHGLIAYTPGKGARNVYKVDLEAIMALGPVLA